MQMKIAIMKKDVGGLKLKTILNFRLTGSSKELTCKQTVGTLKNKVKQCEEETEFKHDSDTRNYTLRTEINI